VTVECIPTPFSEGNVSIVQLTKFTVSEKAGVHSKEMHLFVSLAL
jgi:hypothetical protein